MAKLNSPPTKLTTDRETYLNALNRNYSFVYDNYSNKFVFNYDTDERESEHENSRGYWGYMRDKQADRRRQRKPPNLNHRGSITTTTSSTSSLDSSSSDLSMMTTTTNTSTNRCFWGLFADEQLVEEFDTPDLASLSQHRVTSVDDYEENDESRKCSPNSTPVVNRRNVESGLATKLIYDYKRSQFKIEAGKRDQ